MSLNPNTLQFLIDNIANTDYHIFTSTISQIFNYLDKEIKDNRIYDSYEKEKEKWTEWLKNITPGNWFLPDDYEETKSLSFILYKIVYEHKDNINQILFPLFRTGPENNRNKFNEIFLKYFIEAIKDIINANPEFDIPEPKSTKGDLVFIIHGHDNELKLEVKLLLNDAGVNNIVLHEQPDRGRTIINKLIEETENACYAIALLTPDDFTDDGKTRARQNVILEIGYFIGYLGKERIRILKKDDIEIPSDIQGILYEKYDISGHGK